MPDFIDETSEREEAVYQATITTRVRYTGISAAWCAKCSVPIPEGRRVAVPGVKLCVECAS
jgi:phage/conjugal plasmid C-4 type zinc finger TraR family protein